MSSGGPRPRFRAFPWRIDGGANSKRAPRTTWGGPARLEPRGCTVSRTVSFREEGRGLENVAPRGPDPGPAAIWEGCRDHVGAEELDLSTASARKPPDRVQQCRFFRRPFVSDETDHLARHRVEIDAVRPRLLPPELDAERDGAKGPLPSSFVGAARNGAAADSDTGGARDGLSWPAPEGAFSSQRRIMLRSP